MHRAELRLFGVSMHTSSPRDLSNNPDPDEVVRVTGKEGLAVGGPGEGGTLRLLGLVGEVGGEVGLEVIDDGSGVMSAPYQARCLSHSVAGRQDSLERGKMTHLLSRSKILIDDEVAAQSQYRLGEKTSELTMSPASSE